MRYSKKNREEGFTLIELLVAMALALVVIAALSSTFVIQQKTYNTQEQIAEMTQNARAATDMMTREIRMTGYGTPGNATSDLSSWIDWVSGVTFGSGPIFIETGAGALGSDIIHIAACFGENEMTTTLTANASSTDTSITVADGAKLNTSNKKLISINGMESAIVTGISGNSLTIDTDPTTSGSQGLKNGYQSGDSVCIVKVISYSLVQDADGSYVLKRNENLGAGRQPVAENIVNMQISLSGNTVGIDPLTARTDKPDPDYSQNSGHRTFDQSAFITPPNLLIN